MEMEEKTEKKCRGREEVEKLIKNAERERRKLYLIVTDMEGTSKWNKKEEAEKWLKGKLDVSGEI